MHPKALLDACTELTRLLLRFEHPADSVVSKYFRDQRKTLDLGRANAACWPKPFTTYYGKS